MSRFAFPSLLEFSHHTVAEALRRLIPAFSIACAGAEESNPLLLVDGTCGNGHDTLFLCSTLFDILPEKGAPVCILSFDVQEEALAGAEERLRRNLPQAASDYVTFVHEGHEHIGTHAKGGNGIAVAMYNLGFLPGSGKEVVTKGNTTLQSLDAAALAMIERGLLCVHAYGGHKGGLREMAVVDGWFSTLPETGWAVARYSYCNKSRNPEALYLAEKIRSEP